MKDYLYFDNPREKTRYDRYLKKKGEKNQIFILCVTTVFLILDALAHILIWARDDIFSNEIEFIAILQIVQMIIFLLLLLVAYLLKKMILKSCKKKKIIFIDIFMFFFKMLYMITYLEIKIHIISIGLGKEIFNRSLLFTCIITGIKICLIEAVFLINYFRWMTKIISIIFSCIYVGFRALQSANIETLTLLLLVILLIIIVVKMEKEARRYFKEKEDKGTYLANSDHFKYIFEILHQDLTEKFFNKSSEGFLFIDKEFKDFHHNEKINDFFYCSQEAIQQISTNIGPESPLRNKYINNNNINNQNSNEENNRHFSMFKQIHQNMDNDKKNHLKDKNFKANFTINNFLGSKLISLKEGPEFLHRFFQDNNLKILLNKPKGVKIPGKKNNLALAEGSLALLPSKDNILVKYLDFVSLSELCQYICMRFNKEKESKRQRFGSLKSLNILNLKSNQELPQTDYHILVEISNLYYDESKGTFKEKGFEVMLFPIFKKKKNKELEVLTHFFFLVQDLSLETRIKELALQDQNKSKALAFVSHEMRTPLNCVKGMLQVLKEKISAEYIDSFVKPALASSEFLLNLLNDLLDISQIQSGKFKLVNQDFDLKALMADVIVLFEIIAKSKGVTILFCYEPKMGTIRSDPNRIRQIVTNLMGNAMKFTKQGSITLSVRLDPQDLTLVIIKVEDTGVGIKLENQTKLFQAFGKVDSDENEYLNSQGVGLGLLISNILAKNLGPSSEKLERLKLKPGLNLKSEYGHGTSFKFVIQDNNDTDVISRGSCWSIGDLEPLHIQLIDSLNAKNVLQSPNESLNKEIPALVEEEKRNSQKNIFLKENSINSQFKLQRKRSKSFIPFGISKDEISSSTYLEKANEKKLQTRYKTVVLNDLIGSSIKKGEQPETELFIRKLISPCEKNNCPKILIVDDDYFNLVVLENFLLEFQDNIEKAYNGNEAIEKVKTKWQNSNCCKTFELIFLDIEMPEKNGHETCQEIISFLESHNEKNHILIATTGHTEPEELRKIEKSGFNASVSKPIAKKDMKKILKSVFLKDQAKKSIEKI